VQTECRNLVMEVFVDWYTTSIQGSFFGVRIHFLASEGGFLHKYTNQSQSLRILQPEKRTLLPSITCTQDVQANSQQNILSSIFFLSFLPFYFLFLNLFLKSLLSCHYCGVCIIITF
jgi:hypothetical protein